MGKICKFTRVYDTPSLMFALCMPPDKKLFFSHERMGSRDKTIESTCGFQNSQSLHSNNTDIMHPRCIECIPTYCGMLSGVILNLRGVKGESITLTYCGILSRDNPTEHTTTMWVGM